MQKNDDLITALRALKLNGMADALEQQRKNGPLYIDQSFEQRLSLLVNAERLGRDGRRTDRLVRSANYPIRDASIQDVSYEAGRGLNKITVETLASCNYISYHQNIVIQGASGTGKTYLACALGVAANGLGYKTRYVRYLEMCSLLALNPEDDRNADLSVRESLIIPDVLIIDDWLLRPLGENAAFSVYGVLDERDRCGKPTIFCTQCQQKDWYQNLYEARIADGICDRILHKCYTVTLRGESLRKRYGFRGQRPFPCSQRTGTRRILQWNREPLPPSGAEGFALTRAAFRRPHLPRCFAPPPAFSMHHEVRSACTI